jgi:hypothetical protein
LFKFNNGLEINNEDYGQAVIYRGNIEHNNNQYTLDVNNIFIKGKVTLVSGNTFKILHDSRFSNYFNFVGD